MSLFDLLFLVLFFAAAATAMAAVWSLVNRDMARARRIAAKLVAGAAVYMSAVIIGYDTWFRKPTILQLP
jgi:hypothetical protein